MFDTACYRCGDIFYKGHLTKCKALSRRCFKCQKIGHLSTQCRNSCIGTVNVMVVKKKSTHKKERDQKRWTMFMARHETAIEFPFFNVSDAELISFLKVSRPTVPDQKKRTTVGKKILALRELNNKQQRNIEILEQKLSMSWKKKTWPENKHRF